MSRRPRALPGPAGRRVLPRLASCLEGVQWRRLASVGDGNPDSWQNQLDFHQPGAFASPSLAQLSLHRAQHCPGGDIRAAGTAPLVSSPRWGRAQASGAKPCRSPGPRTWAEVQPASARLFSHGPMFRSTLISALGGGGVAFSWAHNPCSQIQDAF